jgi:hypothetical protein
MDLLRAKIYLDKINREFTRMLKDPENIPRIDVDITLSYIREMYEAFQNEAPERVAAPAPRAVAAPVAEPKPAPPPVVAAPIIVEPPPPPVVVVPPPVVEPAPTPAPPPVVAAPIIVEPPPPPVVVAPPPVVEPKPVPAPPPVVAAPIIVEPPPPPVVKIAPAIPVNSDDAEILFEYKEAKELSEKLSETPLSDIKRAIALNDRLLLQRELFGGDHTVFEDVLNSLNHFSGFEQAKSYLLQNCIGRFDWMHKSRIDTAKSFIRLVRRRYK